MRSKIRNWVIVAAALLGVSTCVRVAQVYAGQSPFEESQRGTFVLRASGFQNNETVSPTHNGEIGVLGLLTFHREGRVSGSLTFTTADSGGDQATCSSALDSALSSSTVDSTGTGTLTLVFPSSTKCVLANGNGGSLVFKLVVKSEGDRARSFDVLLTSFPASTTIAGEPINTLVLEGSGTSRDR